MSRHDDNKSTPKQRWPLLELGYAPATLKKYKPAVHRFIDWCIATGNDAHTVNDLDELLSDYFQQLHDERDGGGKSIAAATLSGIRMYIPQLKAPALPIASAICNRWHKSRPNVSYPPLTWELAVLIAVQMARSGHYRFAVATLLGFDCLMRVGELMSLRTENFAGGKDIRLGSDYQRAMVSIPKAKTGRYQSVPIDQECVRLLMCDLIKRTRRGSLLFPGGQAKFRVVFKATCEDLGLSPRYVPHSLRHGGATRMYLRDEKLEDILLRGRWKSTESARTYIKMGPALQMAMQAPATASVAALKLAKDVVLSLSLTQKHTVKDG
jgi:integrase